MQNHLRLDYGKSLLFAPASFRDDYRGQYKIVHVHVSDLTNG